MAIPNISQNLLAIGALSLDAYLYGPIIEVESACELGKTRARESIPVEITDDPVQRGVLQLYKVCIQAFGHTDCLMFEYSKKRGILTINLPTGVTRTYQTEPIYDEARGAWAQVGLLAVSMGAVNFIVSSDKKSESSSSVASLPIKDDPISHQVVRIKQLSLGRTTVEWFAYKDHKKKNKHGAALRIQHSPHNFRSYSCPPEYDDSQKAQAACATIAIDEGVINFIEQAPPNSLTTPATYQEVLTIQAFYDALPRPFPVDFGIKPAADLNPNSWINTQLQSHRGTKLTCNFYVIPNPHAAHLDGYLLRLTRPRPRFCKTYLVEPCFGKRAEAKSAVALLAISQGIGDVIREYGLAVAALVTEEMRKWTTEVFFPTLNAEYQGRSRIEYTYANEVDAFSCTITLDISFFAGPKAKKAYTTDKLYRSKPDAKTMAACVAAASGVIELLRFRGRPHPTRYVPHITNQAQAFIDNRSQKGGHFADPPVAPGTLPPGSVAGGSREPGPLPSGKRSADEDGAERPEKRMRIDNLITTKLSMEQLKENRSSSIHMLTEYCRSHGLPIPYFDHETLNSQVKVWVEMGEDKIELQAAFRELHEGRETLAREILKRLQSS